MLKAFAGDGSIAILTSDSESLELSGSAVEQHENLGAPVVRVPAETLLDDVERLKDALEKSAAAEVDTVILFPPLGRREGKSALYNTPEAAARNLAAALPPETRLVVLLPLRSISGGQRHSLLEEITADRFVAAVVDFHLADIFSSVHRSSRICAVVLEPAPPVRVVFLSASTGRNSSALKQYYRLISGTRVTESGFLLDGPIDVSKGFLPSQLDPARERRLAEAEAIGELRPLADFCDVTRGLGPTIRSNKEPQEGDIPVFRARDLHGSGLAVGEGVEWIAPSDVEQLQEGDLLLGAISAADSVVVVAVVHDDDLPAVAGRNVIVLRPRPETTPSMLRVIRYFICSTRFSEQLLSNHMGLVQITIGDLKNVLVPLPDDDLLAAFDAVETAASEFELWHSEAETLLESALDGDDLVEARKQLIASSNMLRQRSQAARQLDDLSHRISTRYPLPLAYRWRTVLASRDSAEGLESVLKAQEVLLSYLVVMAVVSARAGGVNLSQLKNIRDRFSRRRGGTDLGTWRAILDEAAEANAMRRLPENHPMVEVREFFSDPDVSAAATFLAALRNDKSHLREVGHNEQMSVSTDAWENLEQLFLAAEFVTEYPLVKVVETRWDSIEGENKISYLLLTGDSPIVPQSRMVTKSNEIEAESLYLIDQKGELHLLRPLLIGRICLECGNWSTFQPDRVISGGLVEYKSLERGHSVEISGVERALAAVGFMEEITDP